MVHDKETINEHIRNALSPIVGLLDLLEEREGFANISDEDYSKFLKIFIKSSRNSVKLLEQLGMHGIEPKDSKYYTLKNKFNE